MSTFVIIREVLMWNFIFILILVGFAKRPEDKDERKRLNREAWSDIKVNILPSVITGTLPVFVLLNFPDKDGFKANAQAFIPLNQVMVYFSAFFLLGLICIIWNITCCKFNNNITNLIIKTSITNMKGVFQVYAGVILAFSVFALKIGINQHKWLFLGGLLIVCAYAMFTPVILADHIEKYYIKKKQEMLNAGS